MVPRLSIVVYTPESQQYSTTMGSSGPGLGLSLFKIVFTKEESFSG